MTLRLGYQYLWIDRYCIDQLDPRDKHLQIGQMAQIYASAQITLIAAAGVDSSYGLPGVNIPRKNPRLEYAVVENLVFRESAPSALSLLLASSWAGRAWTFQEGYLSKRRLVFTDTQMIYVCNEDLQSDRILDPSLKKDTFERIITFLPGFQGQVDPTVDNGYPSSVNDSQGCGIMENYTRRSLSYEADALDAIVGILNCLSQNKQNPVYHIWGVLVVRVSRDTPSWQSDGYEAALNWFHSRPYSRRSGFPSWSPLGWTGPVKYKYVPPLRTPFVEINIPHEDQCIPLAQYIQSGLIMQHSGHKDGPSILQISAPCFPIESAVGRPRKLALPIEDGVVAYKYPYWSVPEAEGQEYDSLLGLISTPPNNEFSFSRTFIWILAAKGKIFERIGVMDLHRYSTRKGAIAELIQEGGGAESWRDSSMPLWLRQAKRRTILLG